MSATANIFLAFYKNGENSDKDIEAFRCESSDILISKKNLFYGMGIVFR